MPAIPLYTFCTPSHSVLRDEWFLKSVTDEYDVRGSEGEQQSKTGEYYSDNWISTMEGKTKVVCRGLGECFGGVFVFSDVDIQFFGPTRDYLLAALGDYDIAFQKNDPSGAICTGFFICRANDATRDFWNTVLEMLRTHAHGDDQDCTELLLQGVIRRWPIIRRFWNKKHGVYGTGSSAMRWRLLGKEIYLPGKQWKPGDALSIPKNILVHHANWTVGIENKIAQLRYVRGIVESRAKKASA
jgi:hypothetical protein